jgi:anaerobic magnesium-protoporphyrin IX monomethyl ester cyclase
MHIAFVSLYDTGAIGLRGLSAFLKSHGHRVSIIFYGEMGRTHREFHQFSKIEYSMSTVKWCGDRDKEEFLGLIERLHPDLIGISLRSAFIQTAIELTGALKKQSSIPVIWGGIHPTLCPEESIQYADIICRGEGEFPFLDLIHAIEQGGEIGAIPNLWVKRNEAVSKNDLRPLNDLDPFPMPDYSEENKYYVYSEPIKRQTYFIMTSRGCPFSCTYCCNSILREIYRGKGKYIRRRSIENVISELLFAKTTDQITEVVFVDDIFVDDPEWLYPFLEEYKKQIRLPFACFLHSQFVTASLKQSLKEAGLYTAALGIQSGSERVRKDIYHRRQTNQELIRSANILNREVGMAYDIIIDNPFETTEDLRESIDLLLQFPYPFRLHLLTLTFFPTYPITRRAIEKGLIQKPNADVSVREWLMIYKEERPKEIQSLYLLIAATQHSSVGREFIRHAMNDKDLLNDPKRLFHQLDQMIKEEDYIHNYRKRDKNLEYLEGVEKVLIIPSGGISTLKTVLQTILGKYPDCLCSVLTGTFPQKYSSILPPERISAFAREERHPLEVISYSGNHRGPRLFGLDWKWVRQLRAKQFDLAVLIHENEGGWGYIHVDFLAILSGAKHILAFESDQSVSRLDSFSFLKSVIERKIRGRGEDRGGRASFS